MKPKIAIPFTLAAILSTASLAQALDRTTLTNVFQRAMGEKIEPETLNAGKFLEAGARRDLQLLEQAPDLPALLAADPEIFRFLDEHPLNAKQFRETRNLDPQQLLVVALVVVAHDGRKAELLEWMFRNGAEAMFKQPLPLKDEAIRRLENLIKAAAACGPKTLGAFMKGMPKSYLRSLDTGEAMAAATQFSWVFPDGLEPFRVFADAGAISPKEKEKAYAGMIENFPIHLNGNKNAVDALDLLIRLTGSAPASAVGLAIRQSHGDLAVRVAKGVARGDAGQALQAAISTKLENPAFPEASFAEIRTLLSRQQDEEKAEQNKLQKGRAYFVARDQHHGAEVWTTDGTTNGTTLFADLVPGPQSSDPVILGIASHGIIVKAKLKNGNEEAFSIDPETRRVTNLETKPGSPGNIKLSLPGGRVLFGDGDAKYTFLSDGTVEGTRKLATIAPAEEIRVHWAKLEGARVIMKASWRKSEPGSQYFNGIAELRPPYQALTPIVDNGNREESLPTDSFSVERDVFTSRKWRGLPDHIFRDGYNMELLTDHRGLLPSGEKEPSRGLRELFPKRLRCGPLQHAGAVVDGKLFFGGELLGAPFDAYRSQEKKPEHSSGVQLYVTDGTEAGTQVVAEPVKGGSYPIHLVNLKGRLLFSAWDGHARRLHTLVDGKPSALSDATSTAPPTATPLILREKAYFPIGSEVWISDGTKEGTRLLHRLEGSITQWTEAGEGCLLARVAPDGYKPGMPLTLWRIGEGLASPVKLAEMPMGAPYAAAPALEEQPTPRPRDERELSDSASAPAPQTGKAVTPHSFNHFRVIYTGGLRLTAREPHVFDSATGKSLLLADIQEGPEGSSPEMGAAIGGLACFWANDHVNGWRIWKSDGTPSGTRPMNFRYGKDGIAYDRTVNGHGHLMNWNGSILVFNKPGRIFRFTPDEGSLHRVKMPVEAPQDFMITKDRMLGIFGNPGYGKPVWMAELATDREPKILGKLEPRTNFGGYLSRIIRKPIVQEVAGKLLLHQSDRILQIVTPEFTNISEGLKPSYDVRGAVVGSNYVFAGQEFAKKSDGSGSYDKYGVELYITDGTQKGTRLLKDIVQRPGDKEGSAPAHFIASGEKVFFTTRSSDQTKRELWITDGTEEGTLRVLNEISVTSSGAFRPFAGGIFFGYGSRFEWASGKPGEVKTIFSKVERLKYAPFAGGLVFHATADGFTGFWWWSPEMDAPMFCGPSLGFQDSNIDTDQGSMMILPANAN